MSKFKVTIIQTIIFDSMAVFIAIYWTIDMDSIRDYLYVIGVIAYNLITFLSVLSAIKKEEYPNT